MSLKSHMQWFKRSCRWRCLIEISCNSTHPSFQLNLTFKVPEEGFLLVVGDGSGSCLVDRHTHSHTHEHIGTVGMETKHSKTPSNHLMTTESAASVSLWRVHLVKESPGCTEESLCSRSCPLPSSSSSSLTLFRATSCQSLRRSSTSVPAHQISAHQPSKMASK